MVFFIFEIMRRPISNHLKIRIVFAILLMTLTVFDLVAADDGRLVANLAADAAVSSLVLLLMPASEDKKSLNLKAACTLSAVIIPLGLGSVFLPGRLTAVALLCKTAVPQLCWCVFALSRYRRHFEDMKGVFKNSSVMKSAVDFSRLFFFTIGLWISLYATMASLFAAHPVLQWMLFVLALGLDVLMLYASYTKRTILVSRKMEGRIKDVISGSLRPVCGPSSGDESASMSRLYSKILKYLDTRKPFLEPGFDLSEMSFAMLTNKSYVSRCINCFSGRNFCQFINYYRIRYATELWRKNPRLKVSDVAVRSGFSSVVSFNMAFRTNMNENPSTYLSRIKSEAPMKLPG